MTTLKEITSLLEAFPATDRAIVLSQAKLYDELLAKLPRAMEFSDKSKTINAGILALNGASGAGQSYVMKRVENLLQERELTLPRIYLLGTREPRPGEGHKDPYIFVKEELDGFQDIHNPDVHYHNEDIYYRYQSRPGADNAILLADIHAAQKNLVYLETVIPTLLHIKENEISGIPPWKDKLKVIYLAAPSGSEWVFRLLNREPDRLDEEGFQATILGRLSSSISDMRLAAENNIPCVLNHYGRAEQAAREIVMFWGL